MENIRSSGSETVKKQMLTTVDPIALNRQYQKGKYVWLATYDNLTRNKNIIEVIKLCTDTILPLVLI